jgi:general secretion pathway protein M
MEKLKALISDVQSWFQRLSARERRLVFLAGGGVAFFIVFIALFTSATGASATQRRTAEKMKKLAEVQSLAATYREAEQTRQDVERQLSASDVRLITFLEERGTVAGLEIPIMNPKGDIPVGDGKIIESAVELTLTDVTLGKFVAFLSGLEQGPGVVKVKWLRIEPKPANQTLTARTTIATYKLKQ